MPALGVTTTAHVTKARKLFVTASKMVGEARERMAGLVDRKTLPNGQGTTWNEPYWPALEAMGLTEGVPIVAPQRLSDAGITITPGEVGLQIAFTRRMAQMISESFPAIAGRTAGNAIARKLDTDLIGYAAAFSVQLGSTSTTLTVGLIGAAAAGIETGRAGTLRTGALATGDPAPPPYFGIFHPYNRYDLQSQLSGLGISGAIGTNAGTMSQGGRVIATGLSEDVIRNGKPLGDINGVDIFFDGNVPIVTNSAVGAVFAREAIVLVDFRGVDVDQEWDPSLRGWEWTATQEYGIGYRSDGWGRAIITDATAPAD